MNNKYEVTDNTCNNECSRCGECCGLFIPFTRKELKKIQKYVKDKNIKPVMNRIKDNSFEARCCFYDTENKKCNIYDVRPYVCRNFMCNHKDWKERRDKYEERAYYNSTKSSKQVLATFDDLVYGDLFPIIQFLVSLCSDINGKVEEKDFVLALKHFNRTDILEHMQLILDSGEQLSGKEILSEEIKL